MTLNSLSNLESFLGASPPFGGVLGLDFFYIIVALLNHGLFSCPKADESLPRPSVLSLPIVVHHVRGGGSLHYCVCLSLAVLYVVSLSFVMQKLFSHPSVLQEEPFY